MCRTRFGFSALNYLLIVAVGLATTTAQAQSNVTSADKPRDAVTGWEEDVMSTDTFLNAHPDLKYMLEGKSFLEKKDYKRAIWSFDLAAYYGDKLSMAALAELYWEGVGVKQDRVKAYSLADMAAERLNNAFLLGLRERYWAELSEAERVRVQASAKQFVDRYADVNTRPRLERALKSAMGIRRVKGYGKGLTQIIAYNVDGTTVDIRPDVFHQDKFWDVKQYTEFKDAIIEQALRSGRVTVKFGGKSDSDPGE